MFDLKATHEFYTEILGCRVVVETDTLLEMDFFGNRIVARLASSRLSKSESRIGLGEESFPVFGLVMSWKDWHRAVDHMNYIGVDFKVAPYTTSKGTQGESAIFCLYDPSDNILEFRAYRNI